MTLHTRARKTDPATSHAAGAALDEAKLRASHRRVLAMFKLYGDMHDKALLEVLNAAEKEAGLKPMSPSGARSRRSELCEPNDQRMAELRQGFYISRDVRSPLTGASFVTVATSDLSRHEDGLLGNARKAADEWARRTLRIEGFRSPLWNTGRTTLVDGRNVTVWGIAR